MPVRILRLGSNLSRRHRNGFRCRISRRGRSSILRIVDALGLDRDHDLATVLDVLLLKRVLCSGVPTSLLGVHANRLANFRANGPVLGNNEDGHQNHPITHQVTFCCYPGGSSSPVSRLRHAIPLVPGLIACSAVFRGRAWQPDRGRHHAAARTSQPWRRTRLHLDRASGLVESVSGRQGPADLAEGAPSQDQPHGSLPSARLCGAHQASDCREIFAWISRCRRLARDDERHVRKAAAFVRRAMIRLMLRRTAASQRPRARTSRKGSQKTAPESMPARPPAASSSNGLSLGR